MLLQPSGPAADLLTQIKRSKAFKRSRIQTRGKGECNKLIIGIGQVHPVLTGRFERFQARRIANVQAEIFSLSRYLHDHHEVGSFGQEGYGGKGHARLQKDLLTELKSAAKNDRGVKPTLQLIAKKWRRALRKGKKDQIVALSSALNGLALLQALDSDVTIFPIEQADVHSAVGDAIVKLSRQISELEKSSTYQSVLRKGGKGLTTEEYKTALTRNKLIKQFNKTLAHPERDRAILREVLKHSDGPVTAFVLGTGHRSNFLTLAAKSLPDGYLLVWVTPPSLWWHKAMLKRITWIVLLGLMVLMVAALRTT